MENKENSITFESLDISEEILRAIKDMGFESPTSIQEQSISIMKLGKDVIGQSQTGTGKTAAFAIPCIEKIDPNNRSLQSLILCPTRELAIQISKEFKKLLKYLPNIKVLPIYGGQPIDRQIMALRRGVHVVIGTPGRVMDHMRRKTLKTKDVNLVILDEADEMLDMGFREDIETILEQISEEHQTMLYSATLSKEIMDISRKYTVNPTTIKVSKKQLTVSKIEQSYFDIRENAKPEVLCRLIDLYDPSLAIIFCNTKRKVDSVTEMLQSRGHYAEGLHGDLKQNQRDKVMNGFRNSNTKILVATDVAARGIDVDNVDIVFNYDFPQDDEYYVHRIGRTGRAGKSGKAFSFIVGREIYKLKDLMRHTKTQINPEKVPTLKEIEEKKRTRLVESIEETIKNKDLEQYKSVIESMLSEDITALDFAAALLQMKVSDQESTLLSSNIDESELEYNRKQSSSNPKQIVKPIRARANSANNKNMIRLFVNIGKKKNVQPRDIVGAIAGETGIPGKSIGAVDIFDNYTFVDIPKEHVPNVVNIMSNNTIKGYKISIYEAKSRPRNERPKN